MGKNKGIIGIIILSSLVVVTIGIILVYKNQISNKPQVAHNSPSPSSQELNTFQSKTMKFIIQVPKYLEVQDNISVVDLNYNEDRISIVKNGTNFDSLKTYINDFDSKRQLESRQVREITINGYEALSRIVELKTEGMVQKSIYIFVDNNVYIMSTSIDALYPALDQIAQSFRYTP